MATIAGVKLADMKRSKESLNPQNPGKIAPDLYSYEHKISLDQDALGKLGITKIPNVGDVFHVMGEGHVTGVQSDSTPAGGAQTRVHLQMKKMGVKPKGTPKASGAFEAVSKGIKEADES